MALVNQSTGQRQGVANYVLYSLAKTAANVCSSSTAPATGSTCVFYDVTKGDNSVACVGGSPNCSNTSTSANQYGIMAATSGGTTPAFSAAAGYDLATGLGTVNVTNLLANWKSPTLIGTTVTLVGPSSSTIGASVTFNGMVTKASGAATPTGTVLLKDMSIGTGVVVDSCTPPACVLSATGAYTITTTLLPASASTYNLVAHYGGDGNFAAGDSNTIAMTVPQQASKVLVSFVNANGALVTTPQSITYGSNYILRIDVTNPSGTPCQNVNTAVIAFVCPTGTVQLFNGTTPLPDFPMAQTPNATSMARLNDRGFAEDQLIQLSPGSYNLNATYTADATSSFTSSTNSNTVAVTVTQATTTSAVTASPTSIASGGSVTLTATVNTTSNGAGPTGTVQFKNGSSNLGSAVACVPTSGIASTSGNASCTATLTTALSELVPFAQPRTRPQVPLLPLGIVSVLLIALLAMQRRLSIGKRLGYAAAGLILFACIAVGIAGCSGSGSGGGGGGGSHTDSITAVYSGDTNYSGSTSSATPVTIQ
jgi:hypothetical protein